MEPLGFTSQQCGQNADRTAYSVDPDRTTLKEQSDLALHCLLILYIQILRISTIKICFVKEYRKSWLYTRQQRIWKTHTMLSGENHVKMFKKKYVRNLLKVIRAQLFIASLA